MFSDRSKLRQEDEVNMPGAKNLRLRMLVQLQISYFMFFLSIFAIAAANALKKPLLQGSGMVVLLITLGFAFRVRKRLLACPGPETAAEKKLSFAMEVVYTGLFAGGLLIAALKVETPAVWRVFFIVGLPLLIRLAWR